MFTRYTNGKLIVGQKLANYWVHNDFVTVENSKMSKSAGNFYSLSDLANTDIEHRAVRFALISAQVWMAEYATARYLLSVEIIMRSL